MYVYIHIFFLYQKQMNQICFDENDLCCEKYVSYNLVTSGKLARQCRECLRDIMKHSSKAVKEEDIMKALEADASQPSLISNNLYLGAFQSAMNTNFLTNNNIQLIINAANDQLYNLFPKLKKYKEEFYSQYDFTLLGLEDTTTQEIDFNIIKDICQQIHQYLTENKGVLIHCAQGKSRSAMVVIFYLVEKCNMTLDEATLYLKGKRSCVQLNDGFASQLKNYFNKV